MTWCPSLVIGYRHYGQLANPRSASPYVLDLMCATSEVMMMMLMMDDDDDDG
jgi:hypothetical protein